jgi:hypothetical protein
MCGSSEQFQENVTENEFYFTQDQVMTHFYYAQGQSQPAETQFKHTRKCLQSIHNM